MYKVGDRVFVFTNSKKGVIKREGFCPPGGSRWDYGVLLDGHTVIEGYDEDELALIKE